MKFSLVIEHLSSNKKKEETWTFRNMTHFFNEKMKIKYFCMYFLDPCMFPSRTLNYNKTTHEEYLYGPFKCPLK